MYILALQREPDILICGNCKEVFPGIHKLIEHKKQTCKLRFTCRCQHTSSPPGAPAMPVCAQCQSRQNTWWDLVQHFQVAHNALLYVKDEELTSEDTVIEQAVLKPLMTSEFSRQNERFLTKIFSGVNNTLTEFRDVRNDKQTLTTNTVRQNRLVDTDLARSLRIFGTLRDRCYRW
ncbi:hypothetical protein AVEN_113991-1 [Araneus ventricosus]|uniref:C2H2-type domain-containing protein n=1 Tax=Araneus ventricosus TaxID=182803 RepID=A0A4Y2JZC4_ARAVE|nr:hypothetical protein AVEN_113991-1 [Araneus ventricosus]